MHRGAVEQALQFDHLEEEAVWAGGEASVPENWDPAYYRDRAKAWRDKATLLPEDDPERAVCVELAEGYEKLATLLERKGHPA
jgi:hypothetical protein